MMAMLLLVQLDTPLFRRSMHLEPDSDLATALRESTEKYDKVRAEVDGRTETEHGPRPWKLKDCSVTELNVCFRFPCLGSVIETIRELDSLKLDRLLDCLLDHLSLLPASDRSVVGDAKADAECKHKGPSNNGGRQPEGVPWEDHTDGAEKCVDCFAR